eukprot:3572817-Rhodomonas_salina.1
MAVHSCADLRLASRGWRANLTLRCPLRRWRRGSGAGRHCSASFLSGSRSCSRPTSARTRAQARRRSKAKTAR